MSVETAATPLSVLSEEENLFRETIREFAETEIAPHVHEMDEASKMRPELIAKFFELGLMGIEVPEQFGGAGGNIFLVTLAVEELARVDASAAIYVDVQNTLFNNAVLRWGSDEQKRRYFPRTTSDTVAAFALSEPNSGSDAFGLETRAVQDGDNWLLTGRKLWITSGAEAGLYIVFANVDPSKGYKGITGFLVERDFPGFSVGKREQKMGIRASSTVELILENCRVPAANVLGQVGQGYKVSIETLNEGRIGIGAQMVGIAQGALDAVTRYVKERKQFGKVLADFQGVQFQVAQMATDLEAATIDGVQRRPAQGCGPPLHPRSRNGEAILICHGESNHRAGAGVVRWLWVQPGIPGREVLSRREDRGDLRGDQQHAAADDCEDCI